MHRLDLFLKTQPRSSSHSSSSRADRAGQEATSTRPSASRGWEQPQRPAPAATLPTVTEVTTGNRFEILDEEIAAPLTAPSTGVIASASTNSKKRKSDSRPASPQRQPLHVADTPATLPRLAVETGRGVPKAARGRSRPPTPQRQTRSAVSVRREVSTLSTTVVHAPGAPEPFVARSPASLEPPDIGQHTDSPKRSSEILLIEELPQACAPSAYT